MQHPTASAVTDNSFFTAESAEDAEKGASKWPSLLFTANKIFASSRLRYKPSVMYIYFDGSSGHSILARKLNILKCGRIREATMKKTKDKITSMLNAITSSGSGSSEGPEEPMKDRPKTEPGRRGAESATSRFKSLRERFQQHMAAAAYAEAGEFEAAAELTEPAVTSKTVLLVIQGESPSPEPFAYALNLCKRTNAELDLLQVIEQSRERDDYELLSHKMIEGSRNIVSLVRQLEEEDIPFKVTIRLGDVSQKLFNYARRHKDVAMVIFDSPSIKKGSEMSQTWSRLLENISHQLSIPLITVEQKEGMPLPARG
jgi:hypothetical protein